MTNDLFPCSYDVVVVLRQLIEKCKLSSNVAEGRPSITANFHIKNNSAIFSLSLLFCTNSSYFETSLSYHTSPPFLPLSFSLRLSLSIFPSPLVFFPLPTINVAFKMPIDLFP